MPVCEEGGGVLEGWGGGTNLARLETKCQSDIGDTDRILNSATTFPIFTLQYIPFPNI